MTGKFLTHSNSLICWGPLCVAKPGLFPAPHAPYLPVGSLV